MQRRIRMAMESKRNHLVRGNADVDNASWVPRTFPETLQAPELVTRPHFHIENNRDSGTTSAGELLLDSGGSKLLSVMPQIEVSPSAKALLTDMVKTALDLVLTA